MKIKIYFISYLVFAISGSTIFSKQSAKFDVISTQDLTDVQFLLTTTYYYKLAEAYMKQNETEVLVLKGHTSPITDVEISIDNRFVISESTDNTVRIWDINTGECIGLHRKKSELKRTMAIDFFGKFIVVGFNTDIVRIISVLSGKEIKKLHGHTGAIGAVSLSRDGRLVATGSNDTTVRVWILVKEQLFDAAQKLTDDEIELVEKILDAPEPYCLCNNKKENRLFKNLDPIIANILVPMLDPTCVDC